MVDPIHIWQAVGFFGFTLSVAGGTLFIVRRMEKSEDGAEEFFSGGRALTWPFVFGSLMLTNLSTESLVGLNGQCWKDGSLVAASWETTAALALVLTASVFLPRFYSQGFVTTPALLEVTFGPSLRLAVSVLFLVMYAIILIPANLYSGAVAFQTMFDLEDGSEAHVELWVIVVAITVIGSVYALGGGLKSVAVSDTLNGIGLLIGGLAVPAISWWRWSGELWEHPERMEVLATEGSSHPLRDGSYRVSVPETTVFTGMLFIQIFYWSTNQVIMQRALCASTFADGQKGLLLAGVFKLVGPAILCLCGVLALGVAPSDLGIRTGPNGKISTAALEATVDRVYPALVKLTLPEESLGLFAAVLLGSVLSSFNSALASASTLFALEIWPWIRPGASSESQVRIGKCFGLGLAVVSAAVAPLIEGQGGVFNLVRQSKQAFALPILVLFLICITSTHPSVLGAWLAVVVSSGGYVVLVMILPNSLGGLHWIHKYFFVLVVAILSHQIVSIVLGAPRIRQLESKVDVGRAPAWQHTNIVSVALLAALAGMCFGLQYANALILGVLGFFWLAMVVFFFVDRSAGQIRAEYIDPSPTTVVIEIGSFQRSAPSVRSVSIAPSRNSSAKAMAPM